MIKKKMIKYIELDNGYILLEYADYKHDDEKRESSPFLRDALEWIFEAVKVFHCSS